VKHSIGSWLYVWPYSHNYQSILFFFIILII
jgi:hypothetical protein